MTNFRDTLRVILTRLINDSQNATKQTPNGGSINDQNTKTLSSAPTRQTTTTGSVSSAAAASKLAITQTLQKSFQKLSENHHYSSVSENTKQKHKKQINQKL